MPETTVTTEHRALSIPTTVKELVEAMVFAASEPLTVKQLNNILKESGQGDGLNVEAVVETLNEEYQFASRPYRIVRIASGYQFATVPEYAEWVGKLYKEQGRRKLSQSSLETLAIVAYKQPITRPDIEAIRGVDCDYVLGTLLEKKLVTITGRAPTPGRPLLYGTTQLFLKHFGLNDISDLPRPREIEELLADSRYETERRMLEAQEQAEKEKREEEDFKSRLQHIPKKKHEMDDSVEIVPKKISRELRVKKDEETGVMGQERAEQSKPESLEITGHDLLSEQDLHELVESSTEVTPTDDQVANSLVNVPAIEIVKGESPVIPDIIKDEESTIQPDAPEVTSNEAVPPSIEISIPDPTTEPEGIQEKDEVTSDSVEANPRSFETDSVLTDSPTPVTEEDQVVEAINNVLASDMTTEQLSQAEAGDAPAVDEAPIELNETIEPDRVKSDAGFIGHQATDALATTKQPPTAPITPPRTASFTAEEVPTESAPTIATIDKPPSYTMTAKAVPAAVPPSVAPIVDEVREPSKLKSRWQQFKEKVQGLLKKVFG